jgi:hypothetical protein
MMPVLFINMNLELDSALAVSQRVLARRISPAYYYGAGLEKFWTRNS